MLKFWLIGIALAMPTFLLGALMGAPWLPTLRKQRLLTLKLLGLKPGQTVLDLGCGGGGLLLEAARQGIRGIGYELNLLLYWVAKVRTFRYRHLVRIQLANYWSAKLPTVDGIYVFLVEHYMSKLRRKLATELKHPTKVVSYGFRIPGKAHLRKQDGLYLYQYNA